MLRACSGRRVSLEQSVRHGVCCRCPACGGGDPLRSSLGQCGANRRALGLESKHRVPLPDSPVMGAGMLPSQGLGIPFCKWAPWSEGSRETPVRGGTVGAVSSEGYLGSRVKSGGLGPLGPSPRDERTRAAAHSPLSSLRCHGARSVSASSQQLPRRPVPGPRDPSWDSPASLCPSPRGGEEVPASAHSNQQVQWGDGAEEGLVVEGVGVSAG